MRSLFEEGLRLCLEAERGTVDRYNLSDKSVGQASAENPLESWSWPELRDAIYGGR